jgi:hypothetical protein
MCMHDWELGVRRSRILSNRRGEGGGEGYNVGVGVGVPLHVCMYVHIQAIVWTLCYQSRDQGYA